MRILAVLGMSLLLLIGVASPALAFNPQPEPPGIWDGVGYPPDLVKFQFQYLYPELNIRVVPGEDLVHNAIGSAARFNPMRFMDD